MEMLRSQWNANFFGSSSKLPPWNGDMTRNSNPYYTYSPAGSVTLLEMGQHSFGVSWGIFPILITDLRTQLPIVPFHLG